MADQVCGFVVATEERAVGHDQAQLEAAGSAGAVGVMAAAPVRGREFWFAAGFPFRRRLRGAGGRGPRGTTFAISRHINACVTRRALGIAARDRLTRNPGDQFVGHDLAASACVACGDRLSADLLSAA